MSRLYISRRAVHQSIAPWSDAFPIVAINFKFAILEGNIYSTIPYVIAILFKKNYATTIFMVDRTAGDGSLL